jgi:hypothetical protein
MMELHPDHGGTDSLATKINRARDGLLHRQEPISASVVSLEMAVAIVCCR